MIDKVITGSYITQQYIILTTHNLRCTINGRGYNIFRNLQGTFYKNNLLNIILST